MSPLKLFEVDDGGVQEWVAAGDAREAALLSLAHGLHQAAESDEFSITIVSEKAARETPFCDGLTGESTSTLWKEFCKARKPRQSGAEPEAQIIGGTEW